MSANLKTRIMRRAYTIWALRKVTSPRVVKSLIFVVAIWQFKEHVFVSKVFENMPSVLDAPATYNLFSSALTHTQLIVQTSILAGAIFGLLLIADFVNRKRATYWF